MKKIAFLCPYFGKLPDHIQLWLNSCEMNPDDFFFLITDDETSELKIPKNVRVIKQTFSEFSKKVQSKFDFTISLNSIKKIGDFKPALGYIYEDLIKDFMAWGNVDVADEIYGNINKFISDDLIKKYDKIMLLGHMSVYKNTKENNRRFMSDSNADFNYKDVYSSSQFFNFEEVATGSIARIYRFNDYKMKQLEESFADISCLNYRFKREYCKKNFRFAYTDDSKYKSIYAWENGKTFGYFLKQGKIIRKEFAYVHFKRRKMSIEVPLDSSKYLIVPNSFIPYSKVTVAMLNDFGKDKLSYTAKRKFRDIIDRLKNKIESVKNVV
ncbi:hypothetical protein QSU93_00580 [Limosilactobacillus fermentum]|uniref:DUF6625 family protein n=1 Tax=Limosilactobacillus fermentum TaxID=1613 RepID=UPI0023E3F7B6|nr:DUF6625 family protein [Limosilactobacillus fermentum]MDF4015986.1 hypothetical protein [Limosilactobacillus fermentum]WJD84936.1 hypothetical protein QSU93_00580 [Limosilactobacillus fermentum]